MIENTYGVDHMRIQGGYGRKAVETNIREYVENGYSEEDARRMAVKIARKFFERKFPGKKYPEHLGYPEHLEGEWG